MHKEVVVRKRSHVIAIIFLAITFMLYAFNGIDLIKNTNKDLAYGCYFVVVLIAVLFISKEYCSCKVSYKYSIIANKLIINKTYKNDEKNLSNVSIKDIVYIGRKNKVPKQYKTKSQGKYSFDIMNHNSDCCVYSENGRLSMFDFTPSDKFIERIIKYNKK